VQAGQLLGWPINAMPGVLISRFARPPLWRMSLRHLGRDVIIEEGVVIQNPEYVSIGDECWLAKGVVLRAGPLRPKASTRVVRGPNTDVEEGVITLGRGVHVMEYASIGGKGGLRIGDHAAIGSRASVYTYTQVTRVPDVMYVNAGIIGANVMIGTNATVMCVGDIPANTSIRPNECVSEVMSLKRKLG
jgi:acetyltransferase-like isoleucine patch superfamily enzyme